MGNQKYKQSHRAKGLCYECSELAAPGRVRCWRHLMSHIVNDKNWNKRNPDYMKNYMKNYRVRMKEEGRCPACSAPLLQEDIAAGKVTCENCIQRNHWER